VTRDSRTVYVAYGGTHNVAVIDAANNKVATTVPLGYFSYSLGIFIPHPRFAGTPGQPVCEGESVSALAQLFGGLEAAAVGLGFPSVLQLQNAVTAFCRT
jgi:YVTN family beta-propeller protein